MGHAVKRKLAVTAVCFFAAAALGCGIPAPPLPPSLDLPAPVADLSAARIGDAVELHWTVPTQNTDKTALKPGADAEICRKPQAAASECQPVGKLSVTAGEVAEFHDVLPAALQAGAPRPIVYKVSIRNAHARSAGESNEAAAIAGAAPAAITNLAAENTPRGIKLTWQANSPQISLTPNADEKAVDRITRTTLNTEVAAPANGSKNPALVEHTLEAPASPINAALDTTRTWGDSYRYRVQQIAQIKLQIGGHAETLEMAGSVSPPTEVQAKQQFPPAAPQGLAVVPVWGADGKPGMDLSWEPNTEPTLAGYQVYRITKFAHRSLERRQMVSGDKLLTAPAFSDRDLEPGTVYRYSVVAVDTKSNVSAESNSVTETARTGPD
jgi:hypothetical protein